MLQEGFNTLATNLSFTGTQIKKILITSCTASEGKSTISMNLLRTFGKLGYRTILIDTDLRRSRLSDSYGLVFQEGEGKGLAHYLAGKCEVEEILYETDMPNTFLVPVGRVVTNSVQLLRSSRMGNLLQKLSEHSDYILLDTPPIGMVVDATLIARKCDGTLLTVQFDSISKRKLRSVAEQLEVINCPVLGTVLNDVPANGLESGYYYKRYYGLYEKEGYGQPKKKGFHLFRK
jgi:capsular exopolysaccharide synthesis family protein